MPTATQDAAQQIPIRLDFEARAQDFSRAMAHLDHAATRQLDQVDFDHRLRELVRIRASQLNGCAYCIDMPRTRGRSAKPSSVFTRSPPGGRLRTSPTASGPRWPSPRR